MSIRKTSLKIVLTQPRAACIWSFLHHKPALFPSSGNTAVITTKRYRFGSGRPTVTGATHNVVTYCFPTLQLILSQINKLLHADSTTFS